MANRDYFTKPIQGGGRESYDYGRTRLHRERPPRDPWMKPTLFFVAAVALYFIWQFLR